MRTLTASKQTEGVIIMSDGDQNHFDPYLLKPIGIVYSTLKRLADCPKQGYDGAPDAWVEIYSPFLDGLDGINPGSKLILLTWLHKSERNILKVHPRNKPESPLRGVFSIRSPARPNPVGLHEVEVMEINNNGHLRVRQLEVLDGTPIIDIKPDRENAR